MAERGEIIHGEVVSADASLGVAFSLFTPNQAARVLASSEILCITDLIVVCAPGGEIKVVDDTDAAGKRIAGGDVTANGGISLRFNTEWQCARGVLPKVIAPAGNVKAYMTGYILRA